MQNIISRDSDSVKGNFEIYFIHNVRIARENTYGDKIFFYTFHLTISNKKFVIKIWYAEQYNQTEPARGKSGLRPFCVPTLIGSFFGDKMKTCSKCKEKKPFSEFYKSRSSKDGHQSYCKLCEKVPNSASHKRYYYNGKGKATRKRYRQSARGKASIRRTQKHYPERIKARNALNRAILTGKLPRANIRLCHYCPKPAKQYHHWHGYEPEHWLDVVPACKECHTKEHRKIAREVRGGHGWQDI